MFRTLVIASVVMASAMAFSPASMMSRRSATKISMSAEFLPGALAPLGYFDPLGFCAGKTEGEVKVKINNMNCIALPFVLNADFQVADLD
jgi:hypothetical protein